MMQTTHCKAPIQVTSLPEDPNPESISKCCGELSKDHYHRCSACGYGECVEKVEVKTKEK